MTTKISDLVVPEIMAEAVQATFAAGATALWGTGAIIMNNSFPGGADKVGTEIQVPYFGSIGKWETITDGSAFTIQKITQTSETATVVKFGKAFAITDWARFAAAGDPYEEAAKQLLLGFNEAVDGLARTAAVATLASMTKDVYNAGVPRTLDYDAVVDGLAKWGDEADNVALMISHSKVRSDVLKQKDSTGKAMFTDSTNGGMARILGMPLGMSDNITATSESPPKYTTVLAKPGALVCWYNGTPLVETGRDIMSGADIVVVSTFGVVHRYSRLASKTKPGIVLIKHN